MAIGKHRVRVIAIVAIAVAIVVAWFGWHRSQHGGGGGRTGGSAVAIPDRDDGPASGALARGAATRNGPVAIDPLLTPMPVSIAGRVLDATTHTPVAGVDVELVGVAKGAGDITATSDVNGGYHADVTTGAWDVRASGNGVIAAPVRVMVATTSGVIAHDVLVDRAATIHGRVLDDKGGPVPDATVSIEATGSTVNSTSDGKFTIEAPAGEARLRADADGIGSGFAMVPSLPPGADLALDIVIPDSATVTGKVVDEKGGAVADADISAVSRDPGTGGTIRLTATSDASGSFQLAIHPGVVSLEARHAGDGTSATTRLPRLEPGGRVEVTLTLGAAVALAGMVVDTNGPVSGARIHARLAGSTSGLPTAISDDHGHFAVDGASAGHYTVEASTDSETSRVQVDLEPDTAPIVITLAATGGIQGTVTFVAPDSTQVADVVVAIERFIPEGDDREARAPFSRQTFAGAEGFRIGGLAPGRYDLIVSAAGHGSAHLPAIEVKDGAWAQVAANLPSGVRLTGTVTAAGQPVAGARVVLDGGVGSAFTDASGGFAFDSVAQGAVVLTVSDANHPPAERSAVVGRDGGVVAIELPTGTSRDLEGIGVVLTAQAGAPKVTAVIRGAPAWGEVPIGATVVAIDGTPVDAGLSTVIARIRGPAGTEVTLTIEVDGERWDTTLVRARVQVHTVVPTIA